MMRATALFLSKSKMEGESFRRHDNSYCILSRDTAVKCMAKIKRDFNFLLSLSVP